MELYIGHPRVAVLVFRNRWIIFLLRRAGKTVGRRDTIDVDPLPQAVDALTVRQIRSAELEISLRGGEGELAALGHSLRRQNKAVGNNRRTSTRSRARESDVRMGSEMKELPVDIIAGNELPLIGRNLTYPFPGKGSIPSGRGGIGYAKEHTVRDGALRMHCDAESEWDIT